MHRLSPEKTHSCSVPIGNNVTSHFGLSSFSLYLFFAVDEGLFSRAILMPGSETNPPLHREKKTEEEKGVVVPVSSSSSPNSPSLGKNGVGQRQQHDATTTHDLSSQLLPSLAKSLKCPVIFSQGTSNSSFSMSSLTTTVEQQKGKSSTEGTRGSSSISSQDNIVITAGGLSSLSSSSSVSSTSTSSLPSMATAAHSSLMLECVRNKSWDQIIKVVSESRIEGETSLPSSFSTSSRTASSFPSTSTVRVLLRNHRNQTQAPTTSQEKTREKQQHKSFQSGGLSGGGKQQQQQHELFDPSSLGLITDGLSVVSSSLSRASPSSSSVQADPVRQISIKFSSPLKPFLMTSSTDSSSSSGSYSLTGKGKHTPTHTDPSITKANRGAYTDLFIYLESSLFGISSISISLLDACQLTVKGPYHVLLFFFLSLPLHHPHCTKTGGSHHLSLPSKRGRGDGVTIGSFQAGGQGQLVRTQQQGSGFPDQVVHHPDLTSSSSRVSPYESVAVKDDAVMNESVVKSQQNKMPDVHDPLSNSANVVRHNIAQQTTTQTGSTSSGGSNNTIKDSSPSSGRGKAFLFKITIGAGVLMLVLNLLIFSGIFAFLKREKRDNGLSGRKSTIKGKKGERKGKASLSSSSTTKNSQHQTADTTNKGSLKKKSMASNVLVTSPSMALIEQHHSSFDLRTPSSTGQHCNTNGSHSNATTISTMERRTSSLRRAGQRQNGDDSCNYVSDGYGVHRHVDVEHHHHHLLHNDELVVVGGDDGVDDGDGLHSDALLLTPPDSFSGGSGVGHPSSQQRPFSSSFCMSSSSPSTTTTFSSSSPKKPSSSSFSERKWTTSSSHPNNNGIGVLLSGPSGMTSSSHSYTREILLGNNHNNTSHLSNGLSVIVTPSPSSCSASSSPSSSTTATTRGIMTHNSLESRKGKKRVTIASSSQIKDVLLEEEIELREQQQQQQHQRRLLEASTTDQLGSCSSSSSSSSALKGRRVRIREDSSNSTEEQQHLDEGDKHLPGVIRRRRDQEEVGNFGGDNGELQQPDGMEREGWVNHHQHHYTFHGVTTTGSINHGAGGSSSQNGTADATLVSAILTSSSSLAKKTSIGVEDGVNSNPMNTASTSAVTSSMSYGKGTQDAFSFYNSRSDFHKTSLLTRKSLRFFAPISIFDLSISPYPPYQCLILLI